MDNYVKILSISENLTGSIVFVNSRKEGGINTIYDPEKRREFFQVFIHNLLPLIEENSWLFESFNDARQFAANQFRKGWELLYWDGEVRRKCGDGGCGTEGGSCSSGSCGTSGGGCGTGGGCSSCSASQDV